MVFVRNFGEDDERVWTRLSLLEIGGIEEERWDIIVSNYDEGVNFSLFSFRNGIGRRGWRILKIDYFEFCFSDDFSIINLKKLTLFSSTPGKR